MDETNYNLYCIGRDGRCRIESCASIILPSSKGGAFKVEDCKDWIVYLIEQCRVQGITRPTFVIDNAPVHSRLDQLEEKYSHVEILRPAPYSYLLNPIELLWNVFKSFVKRILREIMPEVLAIQPVGPTFIADQSMNVLEDVARMSIRNLSSMMLGLFHRVEKYYGISTRQENLVELS